MHEIVAPFMQKMVEKHKCVGEARCIGLFGALEMVKNKDLNCIKEIYNSGEDEFSTNIHMIANAKHLFELSSRSVDEIYDELKEAVEEL